MTNLLSHFKKIIENKNSRFVLAQIIDSQGSVPQAVGASMLVKADGKAFGTIGGGLLEHKCIEACLKLVDSDNTAIFEVDMNEDYSRDAGPICGGSVKIFLNGRIQNQNNTIKQIINHSQNNSSFYIGININVSSMDAGEIVFQSNKPGTTGKDVFWQAIGPTAKMYVVGAGHCGLAISELASWLGFETYLIDERSLNASDVSFTRFVGRFKDFLQTHSIDDRTAIVLVNKGHKNDAEDLEACIGSDAGYIGMIGSERKTKLLKTNFLEEKITSPEYWERIYSPIGLDIAAVEVKEIAISVVTEIVAVFNGKTPDKTPLKCLKL